MCARPANPELREKILKAASEIIEACGPDCVTMREVAEKIGYSPTTLYLYFRDKNAILQETVLNAFDSMNAACEMVMVGPRAIDKFRQYCRAYVRWGVTHPGHYTLMFQVPLDVEWDSAWTEANIGRLTRGRIIAMQLLGEALAEGDLREPTSLRAFNDAGWAALHGATSLSISRRLTVDIADPNLEQVVAVATRTADVLVNCLIAGSGA
ncbi:MAG: TetR/AcrR family transcriptional regulator [Actinobacteria bacterium]|nr:MAG: TetR/AcrR family transcriptional regulator [Actinomycetota bacterium]